MKKSIWFIIVLVAAVIIIVLLVPKKHSSEMIKMGVIVPLSGPTASVGEWIANTVKLASTTRVSYVFEDDQCIGKNAVSAYLKLKQEGVKVFYLGCSGGVLAVAPLAKQNGDLILTGYAGSAEIRKTGDEVIRFNPDAVSTAAAMADYVKTLPSSVKIGLLHEEQDYTKSVALELATRLGDRIAVTEKYSPDDVAFRTQVTKLKGMDVDTLFYIPNSDKAARLIYKEMQTLGYKPHVIGDVNACEFPFSPKDYGASMTCFDVGFSVETPAYKDFLAKYKATYGTDSVAAFYDAVTYDIMKIVDTYAVNHDVSDIQALKKYLLAGVRGEMTEYYFTPDGEVIAANSIKKIEK